MRKLFTVLITPLATWLRRTIPGSSPIATGSTYRRSDGFVSLSTDLMQCNPAAADLQLLVGEILRSQGRIIPLWNAGITMSWPHAKLLLLFLASQVHAYEEVNGPVVISESIRPEFLTQGAAGMSLKQLGELVVRAAQEAGPPTPTTVLH